MGRSRSRWAALGMLLALTAAACATDADTPQAIPVTEPARDDAAESASSVSTEPDDADDSDADDSDTDAEISSDEASEPRDEPTVAEPEVALARFESEPSDVLFDQSALHTFAIDLDPDLLAELDADPVAERYVEGSLTFDGETIGPIGVRYKGSIGAFIFCTDGPSLLDPSGAKTCTKLSMKLKMNWVDKDDTFYGVKKIQLHSQNLDPTKMHERLGYWLFREMGVPVPRSTHARVEVNGDFVGVFALTEQIDGRFTRENFNDGTGNLYKEVWPFNADGSPRPADELIDGLKTNEDDDPTAELTTEFAAALAAAEPGTEVDVLRTWMDVDLLVRTMVVDRAIRNDDGPLHWYCAIDCEPHNFYWYESPTSGELTLVPWDLDLAFDNLSPVALSGAITEVGDRFGEVTDDCAVFSFGPFELAQKSAACDPLIGAIATLTDEFDAIRAEFVAGPFSKAAVDEQLTMWSNQIEPAVGEAATAHDDAPPVDEWNDAVARLIADIDLARETDGR